MMIKVQLFPLFRKTFCCNIYPKSVNLRFFSVTFLQNKSQSHKFNDHIQNYVSFCCTPKQSIQWNGFLRSCASIHRNECFHTSIQCWENEDSEEDKEKYSRDPVKDRSREIPFETSVKYLESSAYKETYGDEPVWVKYRRNFKGPFAPKKTRLTCIKDGKIITGNPCPICRDEYLVVDYRNEKLLKQFISPFSDEVLPWSKTNVCQEQQLKIEVAVEKARIHGHIPFYIPFREYNYDEYKPKT